MSLGPWGIEEFEKDLRKLVDLRRDEWTTAKQTWILSPSPEMAKEVTRRYNVFQGVKSALDLYKLHLDYAAND